MRAVLASFGSIGDVQPCLALGVELQRAGHRVALALPPHFADWASRSGLDFVPIGPDLRDEQFKINSAMTVLPGASDTKVLLAPLFAALPRMYDELRAACAGADVLVSLALQFAGMFLHETTGIPLVTLHPVHYASSGARTFTQALAEMVNPFRRELKLHPVNDPIAETNRADLVLFAMSRHVRPPRSTWPVHYHMPGYFFLDEECKPDPNLVAFLESGSQPIVVTLGSSGADDAAALTELLLNAIRKANRRAVLQHGWANLAQTALPDSVFAAEYVPHAWLFPQACLVIHHGGAGTTASTFRAGVPSLCISRNWDQPVWADLAHELGCAGKNIPQTELSGDKLAGSICEVLSDARYAAAAANLGRAVRSEAGVRKARQLIEDLVARTGSADDELPPATRQARLLFARSAKGINRESVQ